MDTATRRLTISIAEVGDLPRLSPLFDAYRVFYGQPSDLPAAEHFLFERMINHESVIYLASDEETGLALGFAQLYPSFSSVSLQPIWILNDLFTEPSCRRQGVGRALIEQTIDLARERGDKGVVLSTARDNQTAQRLYEAIGFKRDEVFLHYEYLVNA